MHDHPGRKRPKPGAKRNFRGHDDDGIERKLRAAAAVSLVILVIELAGGWLSNSLALLSDAGHVFLDVFAIMLALYASRVCRLPATDKSTYGHHRAETLAALVNGLTLIVLSLVILCESYSRFIAPQDVRGTEMLVIAVIGLAANLVGMWLLHGNEDLNVKGAYFHVLGDTLSSVAVIIGAVAIVLTGERRMDAVLSAFIGVLIISGAIRLIRDASAILLERTPRDIDTEMVRARLCGLDGVVDVHDIHIWSLCSNVRALSAHVTIDAKGLEAMDALTSRAKRVLLRDFNIAHVTLQYEGNACCDPHEH